MRHEETVVERLLASRRFLTSVTLSTKKSNFKILGCYGFFTACMQTLYILHSNKPAKKWIFIYMSIMNLR